MNILIIDDDKALAKSLQIQLNTHDHSVEISHTGVEGLGLLNEGDYDLLLLDLTLPDKSGLDVLQSIDLELQKVRVIVISGREDMDSTIKAIQYGAFDFIRKPLDMDSILLSLEKVKREIKSVEKINLESSALDDQQKNVPSKSNREIIGQHPSILKVLKQIGLLSRNKVNVLIQGDSGSGKELIARALHNNSCLDSPFIPINCSAVVDNLLESELFGYEKGAFTGATETKKGKFEVANDGVIFFDEIGEMSLNLQAKLLRVLQEREFERVGGSTSIPIHCRALFATHRNLQKMVEDGTFREDLYYRIAVGTIRIPTLQERVTDIPILIKHIMGKLDKQYGIGSVSLGDDAISFLQEQEWPGNVRQLENLLLRITSMSAKSFLEKEDFESELSERTSHQSVEGMQPSDDMNLSVSLADMEKQFISAVLNEKKWNITHSAASLQISPTTLRKKIKDYDIKQ